MNRLEIAKNYLVELLQQRPDIVAAGLCGSVAKAKVTDFSDIDLKLLVTGDTGGELIRDGIDAWRAGVYIDAGLEAQKDYSELDVVLSNPFKATAIYDARILYDPTGFLVRLQQAVRTHYLEPPWVNKRVSYWVEQARVSLLQLREGSSRGDVLRICEGLGWFTFACACVPLFRIGQISSSMKTLQQLEPIAPTLREDIIALESTSSLSSAAVFALEPLLLETIPALGTAYGQLPGFYVKKAMWMVQQGQPHAALHALWLMMAITAGLYLRGNDTLRIQGTGLMARWLQALGGEAQTGLVPQIPLAEQMFSAIEALVTLSV